VSLEARRIGSLSVSVLGLGVGNVTDRNADSAGRILRTAVEEGITYFDISNRPESTEHHVGRALAAHRDEVVIATKFGSRPSPGVLACATPAHTRASVEASLTNLGTDRLDLVYLHRPDPDTPIADTLGALGELVTAGQIREIACSKFTAAQLREADAAASGLPARFVGVENPCSLLNLDDEDSVLPVCAELGLTYMAYWPLAAGLLSGKYRRGEPPPAQSRFARSAKWLPRVEEWHTERNYEVIDRLTGWATARGCSLIELAFAWLRGHAQIGSMIAGASSPEQLRANVGSAQAVTLSPAEFDEVTELARTGAPVARGRDVP
jgi:aryl-alcohol dehydrogenase-like predicted oxidoreductase